MTALQDAGFFPKQLLTHASFGEFCGFFPWDLLLVPSVFTCRIVHYYHFPFHKEKKKNWTIFLWNMQIQILCYSCFMIFFLLNFPFPMPHGSQIYRVLLCLSLTSYGFCWGFSVLVFKCSGFWYLLCLRFSAAWIFCLLSPWLDFSRHFFKTYNWHSGTSSSIY